MKNEHEREEFFEENFARLPIAEQTIGVWSRIKLAALAGAMRGIIQQHAPGMANWE